MSIYDEKYVAKLECYGQSINEYVAQLKLPT